MNQEIVLGEEGALDASAMRNRNYYMSTIFAASCTSSSLRAL
jgi:hypothetical protein